MSLRANFQIQSGSKSGLVSGQHRVDFEAPFKDQKPEVLVSLSGFHAGTPGGVATVYARLMTADQKGFHVQVGEAGSAASVDISYIAFG